MAVTAMTISSGPSKACGCNHCTARRCACAHMAPAAEAESAARVQLLQRSGSAIRRLPYWW